ncbi:MAG: GNAT family N-acetyltransferase [Micrococcaceae bacterium]|uniref:GNAT family N-acetyltransferase n=1 Tax=Arthrobacter rhombi TaxID=71253 RepID=UPI0026531D94|nr:GNAT family N-acetyltransferase [Micrococcaceae bacterium]
MGSRDIGVRHVVPGDVASLADLVSEWKNHEQEAHMIRVGTLRHLHEYRIARDGSRDVGWLKGHHEQPTMWQRVRGFEGKPEGWLCSFLASLFVTEAERGHGVATALLDAFENEARDQGNSLVMVSPDASEFGLEERLREFYGKRGYYLPEAKAGNSFLLAKSL